MSIFSSIELFPEDAILGLASLFAAERNPNKVNLGIGSYKNDQGESVVLSCVREAEKLLLEKKLNKDYAPIDGISGYTRAGKTLIFGEKHAHHSDSLIALQTVGGTGALRIAGEFLSRIGKKTLFLPEPTWPNHKLIFSYAGMQLSSYPYYNLQTHSVNFPEMCKAIQGMPSGSVILLHGCCHNPTGIDPTPEQWQELSTLIKRQHVIPLFDLAYQGFGTGLDEDAFAVRHFISEGHEMFVTGSFAKNLGLYGERAGLLALQTADTDSARRVISQLKQIVRGNYSSPPIHGARIVETILQSQTLSKKWHEELGEMRQRIKEMRKILASGLAVATGRDYSFLTKQLGIFSYTGLNKDQVMRLRHEYGIYMTENGRANVAGINSKNIDYVVKAFSTVLRS